MKINRQWIWGMAVLLLVFGVVLRLSVESSVASTSATTVVFAVEKLSCGACSDTIRAELSKLDGIAEVTVDVGRGLSRVRFDPRRIDASSIAEVITAAGYPARQLTGDLASVPATSGSTGCNGGCCAGRTR